MGKSGHRLLMLSDMVGTSPTISPERPNASWPQRSHCPALQARLLLLLTTITCHFPRVGDHVPMAPSEGSLSAGSQVGGHCP